MPDLTKYQHPTDIEYVDDDFDEGALAKIEEMLVGMAGETVGLEELDDGWGVNDVDIVKKKSGNTSDDACPDSAKKFDIWSKPGGELLWKKKRDYDSPWTFVVVHGFPSRIRFPDDSENVDFCKSSDAKKADRRDLLCKNCPDLPGPDNPDSPCNNVRNFIVVPTDLSGIFQLQLSGSDYREANTIIDALKKERHAWDRVFGLTTTEKSSDQHSWVGFKTSITEQEPSREVKATAQFVRDQYTQAREQMLTNRNRREEVVEDAIEEEMDDDELADSFSDPSEQGDVSDTL